MIWLAMIMSLLVGGVASPSLAATHTAASCSRADVAAKTDIAAEGDTVVIPDCPAGVSWTTTLTITKAISLRGATACTLDANGVVVDGSGCQTIIIDNVPKGSGGTSCVGTGPLIDMSSTTDQAVSWRWSHFQINGSEQDIEICVRGHLIITSRSHSFRIDHIKIKQETLGMTLRGDMWGVVDHFKCGDTGQSKRFSCINPYHGNWNGNSDGYGDASWSEPLSLGTEKAIFIEDSEMNDELQHLGVGAIDPLYGARIVFRYNRLKFVASHGTESGGRIRGFRQFEIYNNTFTSPSGGASNAFYIRSGTGVIYNNTLRCRSSDCASHPYYNLINYENDRDADTFSPWGYCDGLGGYDNNTGTIYHSGTHTGANGASVLTDSAASFGTLNTGYSVRNTTQSWSSTITSNTGTTITRRASLFGYSYTWNTGDAYTVRLAYPCIDQIGRGPGALLSGVTPSPTGWVSQTSAPAYQWNNSFACPPPGGTTVCAGASVNTIITTPISGTASTHVQSSRDYYDNATMPGYTAYTYPHPLQGYVTATTSSGFSGNIKFTGNARMQ